MCREPSCSSARRNPPTVLFLLLVGVFSLVLASPGQAQTVVGVLEVQTEDGATEVAGRVEALLDRSLVLMHSSEARSALSGGQVLTGTAKKADAAVSKLQAGVDAFYDDRMDEAERLLTEGINDALEQPMLLTLDARLVEQARTGMLTLPSVLLSEAHFDEAAQVTTRVVETFPTYSPSRKLFPPGVVDMVEQSRVHASTSGRRLLLKPASGETCVVNLNGDQIVLSSEREVPVTTASYGLLFTCDALQAGPFLTSMNYSHQTLVISPAIVAALAQAAENKPIDWPADFEAQHGLATTLKTLLGVEVLYVTAHGADGVLLARADEAGYRAARTAIDSDDDLDLAVSALLPALERGAPEGDVEVNNGLGWERLEAKSYWVETIVIGTGGATLVAGAVFAGIAASQADVVEQCKRPELCTLQGSKENLDLYAQDVFASQLLFGIGSAIVVTGATILVVRMLSGSATEVADTQWNLAVTGDSALGTCTWRW